MFNIKTPKMTPDKINCNTFSSPLPTVDRPPENKKAPICNSRQGSNMRE